MVSIQLPPREFRERLHDRDYFLQAADEAAADFEQGLAIWQDQKLEAIASTERLSAIITAILAVLSIASRIRLCLPSMRTAFTLKPPIRKTMKLPSSPRVETAWLM